MIQLPEGFEPLTASEFLAADESIDLPVTGIVSIKLAVPLEIVCKQLRDMEAAGLVRFAMQTATEQYSIFIERESDPRWAPFSRAIADCFLLNMSRSGEFDSRTGEMISISAEVIGRTAPNQKTRSGGTIPEGSPVFKLDNVAFDKFAESSTEVLTTIADTAHMSPRVVRERLKSLNDKGVIQFVDVGGRILCALAGDYVTKSIDVVTHAGDRAVLRALQGCAMILGAQYEDARPLSFAELDPIVAVNQQAAALKYLSDGRDKMIERGQNSVGRLSIGVLFGMDIDGLDVAETYAWYKEPTIAVEAAAASLPGAITLSRTLTRGRAGFWYFYEPLAVATVDLETDDAKKPVVAVLWQWLELKNNARGVYFSAYVLNNDGIPTPTTKWFWRDGTTLDQKLIDARAEYQKHYGPGGQYHGMDPRTMGVDATVDVVGRLGRFFVAGCLWLEQRILTADAGHVERHARKRIERDRRRPMNPLHVVMLRRRQSVKSASSDGTGAPVDWACRWLVSGHWRKQFHPSDGSRRDKWINAFEKGPADKPLKAPTRRVFTVAR